MFTGIITEQGHVVSRTSGHNSAVLVINAPHSVGDFDIGGSIAVDGVCLTATAITEQGFTVDVIGETLNRTTLGELQPGHRVNIERCVPVKGRLDGHLVQGHVDGVGTIIQRENQGTWEKIRIAIPGNLARYVVEKGSIAVDGVSLTVTATSDANDTEQWFEVGLIPTTLVETGLGPKQVSQRVNLEVDIIAKYTERLLAFAIN